MMSGEMAVLLRPRQAFREVRPVAAAYIPAYVLWYTLVIAVAVASSATERVDLALVLSLAFVWLFVPVVQVVIALALAATSRRRLHSVGDATTLLLMAHAPWSLALLLLGALGAARLGHWFQLYGAIAAIAIALTVRAIYAFCREVLGASTSGAIVRTGVHQAITYAVAIAYVDWAVGGLAQRFMP